MGNKLANLFMIAGAALIIAALSLFVYNRYEADAAEKSATELAAKVTELADRVEPVTIRTEKSRGDREPEPEADTSMTVAEIDGFFYIGYLSIPKAELELPVMSDWNYDNLKLSPCRYTGSTKTDNLVICAHNYSRHFGILKNMTAGDEVLFTDMDGETWAYEVVTVETLEPGAVEEMTDGEYDLTLFTCTYGGATRIAVRCESEGIVQ